MNKIILPGGSGFLGTSFRDYVKQAGGEAIVLTRNPQQAHEVGWDAKTLGEWQEQLIGADGVVNFTGRSVNCVHNEKNRKEIMESRVNSVRVIDEAIAGIPEAQRPRVVIQAGSLAIYGDTRELCDEHAPHGDGFPADVCKAWEQEFFARSFTGVRKCLLRIGIALGPGGGALVPLRNLTRCFLGGTVGSGDQYLSWFHVEDFNRMILKCIEDESLEGTFNATGPSPATNREFMAALRRALGRPWCPPAPAFLVRFGARWILKTDADLALTGRNCIPRRFQNAGFTFKHTDLDQALQSIMEDWR